MKSRHVSKIIYVFQRTCSCLVERKKKKHQVPICNEEAVSLDSNAAFIEQQGKVKQARVRGNNRCHVGRAESATGTMQRSGQAADREDITRQAGSRRQAANGQSRIGSPGKQNTGETLRMSAGAKQDFATCVGKCAAYMWVSE